MVPIPLYIPNILCYVRIILSLSSLHTALLVSSHEKPAGPLLATILIWLSASLLDHIDGKVARACNQCSEFGVILDIVADNVLRGCSWIAVVIAVSTGGSTGFVDTLTLIISICAICMEWLTMLSTQMLTLLKEDVEHWKELEEEQDEQSFRGQFVKRIFRSNFMNPIGALAIFGSFASGMLTFVNIHKNIIILPWVPWDILRYASYLGRTLALCVEIHFCLLYAQALLIKKEEKPQVKQLL
jgi:CDP-diacylglycerol--inositol 3-phosphatidyltransferase